MGGVWVSFFFQAEDGIRCCSVFGVQTCALPVSRFSFFFFSFFCFCFFFFFNSEKRGVGKKCISRGLRYNKKKKKIIVKKEKIKIKINNFFLLFYFVFCYISASL